MAKIGLRGRDLREREREKEREQQELRLRASAGGYVIPVASFAQTHRHRNLVSRIFFSSILLHLLYTHYWLPTKFTSILFSKNPSLIDRLLIDFLSDTQFAGIS